MPFSARLPTWDSGLCQHILLATTPSLPLHACHFYFPQSEDRDRLRGRYRNIKACDLHGTLTKQDISPLQDIFPAERKTLRGATCPPHKGISQLTEKKKRNQTDKKDTEHRDSFSQNMLFIYLTILGILSSKGKSDNAYIVDSGITLGSLTRAVQ